MKKNLALIVYIFAIGFLSTCTTTIVIKLIFWPPCTQRGNICIVDAWSVAGLAATILGVSATVLTILGAVGVAGWWIWLNDRVKNLITILYKDQKKSVDELLENQKQDIEKYVENLKITLSDLEKKVEQSQKTINSLNETLNDFEDSIAKSFAAMGPLLAEPVALRAANTSRFPTFPFYMVSAYIDLIQQENKFSALEQEIAICQKRYNTVQKEISKIQNPSTEDAIQISSITDYLKTRYNNIKYLNDIVNNNDRSEFTNLMILDEYHRMLFWWKMAKDNKPKMTSLESESFEHIEKEVLHCSSQIMKAEQNFDKLKLDTQSLLSLIESLIQSHS